MVETFIIYENNTEEHFTEETVNLAENGVWILGKEKVKINGEESSKQEVFIPYTSISKVVRIK